MSGSGPWRTTPARTGTGPVTRVLRSSANEWGRRDHSEDWGRHGAHSLPNATQMQHETGKPLHIKGLLRILIPPFPGSNPGAPASQRGLCIVSSPQFVRWTDRSETVLIRDVEVDRRCRALGITSQP